MATWSQKGLTAGIKLWPINLAIITPDALTLLQYPNYTQRPEAHDEVGVPDDLDLGSLNHWARCAYWPSDYRNKVQ